MKLPLTWVFVLDERESRWHRGTSEPREARVVVGPADGVVWRNRALMLFDRVTVPLAVCDTYGLVLLTNPAMAAEFGTTPGRLRDRHVLELFRPQEATQVERIAEALRLRHRARYQVSVRWNAPGGAERYGELTADLVSDNGDEAPALLVMLRVRGENVPPPEPEPAPVTPVEGKVLALLAAGATTDRAARELGLSRDGVTYHLRRLSARWGATNRTELVARAYALGVLTPGAWPPEAGVGGGGG